MPPSESSGDEAAHSSPLVPVAIVAATVVVLRLEGRIWWCWCGSWALWAGGPRSPHNSQHLLDPYSLTHILHGVLLCGVCAWLRPRWSASRSLCATVFLESLWEIVENSPLVIDRYRTATIALGYQGDSVFNSLGDILSCALGFLLARRLGWTWSAIVVVTVELGLLWWIRDNLLLNILMLLRPIEAIRAWQSSM